MGKNECSAVILIDLYGRKIFTIESSFREETAEHVCIEKRLPTNAFNRAVHVLHDSDAESQLIQKITHQLAGNYVGMCPPALIYGCFVEMDHGKSLAGI